MEKTGCYCILKWSGWGLIQYGGVKMKGMVKNLCERLEGILLSNLKTTLLLGAGVVGGFASSLLGGWDTSLQTLVIFMAIDYITGFIVAAVFKESSKTESGALESRAGFKGICRKGAALLIVLIGFRLDILMETAFIRDAVVIAFIVNEGISITENAGIMGIPVPKAIKDAIDILKSKEIDDKYN